MDENLVIEYVGESRKGLTVGKKYAVETNEDYIDAEVFENFESYTVFDDNGELREVDKGEYQVIQGTTLKDWFNARSEKRRLQQY